jgi:hypothetical protein
LSKNYLFQEDNIQEHLSKLTKIEAIEIASRKKDPEQFLKNRLEQNKKKSQLNRYKVVNCCRKKTENTNDTNATIIFDVVKEVAGDDKNDAPMTAECSSISKADSFVYDIYVNDNKAITSDFNPESIDLSELNVQEYEDFLYANSRFYKNDSDDESANNDDDADSNDENYFANDYPDEDYEYPESDASIDERHMRSAMKNFNIDNELSSDDESQDFVHTTKSEDDFNYFGDMKSYGKKYAQYKRKCIKELEDDNDDDESSSED